MSENIIKTWLGEEGKFCNNIFGIDMIFQDLSNYYRSMIHLLSQKTEEFNSKSPNKLKDIEKHVEEVANEPNNLDVEDFKHTYSNFLFDRHMEMQFELSYIFPQYFRTFFLVQLYNYTESELKAICDYLFSKKIINVSFSTFRKSTNSSYLISYLEYLSEYAGLEISIIENENIILERARTIRNQVLHNSGIIKEDNEDEKWKLIDIMAQHSKQIELRQLSSEDEYEIIIPNDLLITDVLESSKNLFKKLLEDGLIKVKWN